MKLTIFDAKRHKFHFKNILGTIYMFKNIKKVKDLAFLVLRHDQYDTY